MGYEVISLDSNVVIAALNPGDAHHEAAVRFLDAHAGDVLVLPAAVYAEVLALPGGKAVRKFLEGFRLRPVFSAMDSSKVWELAAERYAQYVQNRRRSGGGEPRRILADFLIGAQALAQPGLGYTPAIATFDPGVYARYFPELKLYDPRS